MRGLTLYVCVGSYSGWQLRRADIGWRLVLGWLSIALLACDIEAYLAYTARTARSGALSGEGRTPQ